MRGTLFDVTLTAPTIMNHFQFEQEKEISGKEEWSWDRERERILCIRISAFNQLWKSNRLFYYFDTVLFPFSGYVSFYRINILILFRTFQLNLKIELMIKISRFSNFKCAFKSNIFDRNISNDSSFTDKDITEILINAARFNDLFGENISIELQLKLHSHLCYSTVRQFAFMAIHHFQ